MDGIYSVNGRLTEVKGNRKMDESVDEQRLTDRLAQMDEVSQCEVTNEYEYKVETDNQKQN